MGDNKISTLSQLTSVPDKTDFIPFVDTSDTSQSAGGSTKRITIDDVSTYLDDNLLINPGISIFQRQAPETATSRSDDAYGPDRWYVLTQTAAVNCLRISGDTQRYAWRIVQNQTAAQRFGCAQIVEGMNCHHMKDRIATFGGRIRISSGMTLHAAILEWTGTEDAVTSDFVNNWNSQDDSTGNFIISSNYRMPNTGIDFTLVSGQWVEFETSGLMSSGLHNIVVGAWTKTSGTTNINLDGEAFQLY